MYALLVYLVYFCILYQKKADEFLPSLKFIRLLQVGGNNDSK